VQCQLTKIDVAIVGLIGLVWSLDIPLGEQSLVMQLWLGKFQMIQLLMLVVNIQVRCWVC
jgi:hypothetical protein